MHNIQEDDFQHLHLFTEYGRLALEQSNDTPFQHLLFIVHDGQNQHEIDYGSHGQVMLNEILDENDDQTDEMRQLRKEIRSSFAEIGAFLMLYPGKTVASGTFTGYRKHGRY